MKKIKLLFIVLLAATVSVYGQRSISGTVTDAHGGMPGVTIVVTGTTQGTITDIDGNFQLMLPAGATEITVSSLGFVTQVIPVEGQNVFHIRLQDDALQLDEFVVVGYGVMRRSDITGAVTSVRIDENVAARATSFDQLLQGRAAGVQVTANSHAPGAASNIRIRGLSSFSGGGEPLFVVDGVILNSPSTDDGGVRAGGMSESPTNALMGIHPQDIASMEILKDASATAIFGNLGANGVILITTRQGTSDRPSVSWTSSVDVSRLMHRHPMMDFNQYVEFIQYKAALGNSGAVRELGVIFRDSNPALGLNDGVVPVDWQDWTLRNSVSHRHRLSISGRTDRDNYLIAIGFTDNQGIVRETGLQQLDFRLNYDTQLSRQLRLGTRISATRSRISMQQGAHSGASTSGSMMRSILAHPPHFNFQTLDNVLLGDEDDDDLRASPATWLIDNFDNTTEYRIMPNLFLEFSPFSWLTYRVSVGADYRYRERERWRGPLVRSAGPIAVANQITNLRYNIDHMFMFNHIFDTHHRVSGTLGTTMVYTGNNFRLVEGEGLNQIAPQSLNVNAAPIRHHSFMETSSALLSYLGRVVYSFRDRYVITATYRIDGSSKFTRGNRWGTFPSFAAAWNVTEEDWNLPQQLSSLRLRAGWGRVGNEAIGAFQTRPVFFMGANNMLPDHSLGNMAGGIVGGGPTDGNTRDYMNPYLTWETTEQVNIGLDFSLFNRRLSLYLDAYNKLTRDLLQQIVPPHSTGFGHMWINRGTIQNRGVELAANARIIETRDFSWSFGVNASVNRNKILDIGTEAGYFMSPSEVGGTNFFRVSGLIFKEGHPMGLFWGHRTNGLVGYGEYGPGAVPNSQNNAGRVRYVLGPNNTTRSDAFPEGWITADDREVIGSPHPDLVYGFNTAFSFRRWELSMNFNGVLGVDMINLGGAADLDMERTSNVRAEAFFDRWTPENPNARFPRFGGLGSAELQNVFSDRFVEDASFLRLSNITLNYELPLRNTSFIRSASLSLTATNVFVITNYSGWDPEAASFGNNMWRLGTDSGAFPPARTFSLGASLNF